MSAAANAGSDESFAFLCFGFVTSLLLLSFLPALLSFVWDLRSFDRFVANLGHFWQWLTTVPRLLLIGLLRPGLAATGLSTLLERREFALSIALPTLLRRIIRPRAVLLVLFCILLPIVLYQKLSFDPHEILQVPKDADEKVIKKSYRKLSMLYHPDKNKTEEARVLYTQVRRAYKMLADPQAFEEEMQNQAMTAEVSVALPRFLLDPEYRRFAAPLLLGTLFFFPVALIYMLRGSDNDKALRDTVDCLIWMQDQYNYFYRMMGEPENCTNGKPDDVAAQWRVDDTKFAVAQDFLQMCNDRVTSRLHGVYSIIVANKHYRTQFKDYKVAHEQKLEQLLLIREACTRGERPARQIVTAVQNFNRRLEETMKALEPTESRLHNRDVDIGPDGEVAMDGPPAKPRPGARPRGRH